MSRPKNCFPRRRWDSDRVTRLRLGSVPLCRRVLETRRVLVRWRSRPLALEVTSSLVRSRVLYLARYLSSSGPNRLYLLPRTTPIVALRLNVPPQ